MGNDPMWQQFFRLIFHLSLKTKRFDGLQRNYQYWWNSWKFVTNPSLNSKIAHEWRLDKFWPPVWKNICKTGGCFSINSAGNGS